MKRIHALLLSATLYIGATPAVTAQSDVPAQSAAAARHESSPYKTRFAIDGPITLGLGALSATGLYLVQQKHGLTEAGLAALDRNDVPRIDRFAAGNYSESYQLAGDLLCYPTLLIAPGLLALNDKTHGHYGQIAALYLETMLAADAIFTMTVGTTTRYRPYLYGTEGGSGRTGKIATNSFFAGHTAHTATATFFAAKVYHDFNPGSGAEPWIWGAAAVVPMAVAYTRIEAGKHFLTDNLVGYALGATMGVVVPQLHKKSGAEGLSVLPMFGVSPDGTSSGGLMLTKRL